MNHLVFESPWAFAFLVPLFFAIYRVFRRSLSGKFPIFPRAAELSGKKSYRQTMIPPILFFVGMLLLVIAAARPVTLLSQTKRTADAIAIEMTIDISGSMESLDFATAVNPGKTRLDVVKETFSEFVSKRPDDLIGIVTFGGYATTRAPLTTDHEALVEMLESVYVPGARKGDMASREETLTAMGDGLAMACARLNSATNMQSRIVILLSDGASNYGIVSPDEASSLARQLGIKVYTIGIGSPGGMSPVSFGGFRLNIPSRSEFDEEGLRKIADNTGGRYFNVTSEQEMEKALEEIDALQKTRIEESVYKSAQEYYASFLWPGLLCALAGTLFPVRIAKGVV